MGIRIFRQVFAVLVSLSVATPVWSFETPKVAQGFGTSASIPGGTRATSGINNSAAPAQMSAAQSQELLDILNRPEGEFGVYTPQVEGCERARANFVVVCKRAEAAVAGGIALTPITGGNNVENKVANENAKTSAMIAANQAALTTCSEALKPVNAECTTELPAPRPDTDDVKNLPLAHKERKAILDKGGAYYAKYAAERTSSHNTMAAGKKGLGDIWKYVAAAGVGAGAMYLLKGKGDKKKEESAEDKKAAAAKTANGVIKDANGAEITCFSPEHVTNPSCKSTLLSLCQGEKGNTAGCRSFEAAYCAGEGNGSNYCLYAEAKVYCAQSGDMIAQSPACTWKSARPASCNKDPEAVTCLASGTPDALALSCGKYPNDPLCKANSAGRVVVQGGGSANAGNGTAAGSTVGNGDGDRPNTGTPSSSPISYADGSGARSVSMSSVIGSGNVAQQTGASNLAVISPSENMWSSAGSAVKKACAAGQLLNCL